MRHCKCIQNSQTKSRGIEMPLLVQCVSIKRKKHSVVPKCDTLQGVAMFYFSECRYLMTLPLCCDHLNLKRNLPQQAVLSFVVLKENNCLFFGFVIISF